MSYPSLFFIVALLLALTSPSTSWPLSRRATLSTSARSSPRFLSNFSPSSHQRRSIEHQNDDDDLLPMDSFYLVDDSSNLRRSLDTDSNESQDESLDQEKADANNDWEQFVAATPGEDLDSYPDSFADDVQPDFSCSDAKHGSKPSTSSNTNGKGNSSGSQSGTESKPNHANSLPVKNNDDDDGAAKKKEAEVAKQQKAEAAKQQQEAEKQKKAELDKQQEAEAAQAKKDAEAKKQEAQKKQAALPAKPSDDTYRGTTGVQPIPATPVTTAPAPVTTGTAHSSHSSEVFSGDGTFFTPDVGACGKPNTSEDMIVAVSHILYDSFYSVAGNPNTNEVCGKRIRATYEGKHVEVTVADRCEGCDRGSLDFTPTAFRQLAPEVKGRLKGVTWIFI